MDRINSFMSIGVITVGDSVVTVGQILIVPCLFIAGYLIARWLGRLLTRKMTAASVNADIIHLVNRVYLVAVIATLVITALELLNVPLTAFAFISGAIAIGVGFGAQNIINNFISGWILLWERPIRIGDFLEIGDIKGSVEAINTRSTRIKRVDGVHLLIPNSHLLENMVVNWTLVDELTRAQVSVGVAYGSPVRKVEALLYQAIEEHPDILKTPKPSVVFDAFGDNSLNFELFFWALANSEKGLRIIRSDLRFRIDELFHEHNITIAFPQRDVHIDSLSPIEIKLLNRED